MVQRLEVCRSLELGPMLLATLSPDRLACRDFGKAYSGRFILEWLWGVTNSEVWLDLSLDSKFAGRGSARHWADGSVSETSFDGVGPREEAVCVDRWDRTLGRAPTGVPYVGPTYEVHRSRDNSPVVLHVPHASRRIPNDARASIVLDRQQLERELDLITDDRTDWIAHSAALACQVLRPSSFVNRLSRLVVVHSYPVEALPYELDAGGDRPEICIGTDPRHTSPELVEAVAEAFDGAGSIALDTPFSGSYVPLRHYLRDDRVNTVMLEFRRDLVAESMERRSHTGANELGDRVARLIDRLSTGV